MNYNRSDELIAESLSDEEHTFTSTDSLPKPSEWALYQSKERGFDPKQSRYRKNRTGNLVEVEYKSSDSGCREEEWCRGDWRGCWISLSCVILNVSLIFIFHYLSSFHLPPSDLSKLFNPIAHLPNHQRHEQIQANTSLHRNQ
jgi:hypothetical protein